MPQARTYSTSPCGSRNSISSLLKTMKILFHSGVTRTVILTKRWAIKIPSIAYGWKFFLYGFLANMQEVDWRGFDSRLCPILLYLPYGFLVVMPRCRPLTDDEFIVEVPEGWIAMETGCELPVEMKTCSFGRLNGRIVAVDYGGCGRDGRTTTQRGIGVKEDSFRKKALEWAKSFPVETNQ